MRQEDASKDVQEVPWSKVSSSIASSAVSFNPQGHHEKLREYETRRRKVYTSKFDSMSIYWKSYRDMLSVSVQETGRAQRLVVGTCRAHQLYSDAMHAMHDDVFLDEKGNITTEKQRKRLSTTRKRQYLKPKLSGTEGKRSSVLQEIRDTQKDVAQRFSENAKNMDEEIAEAIGSLLDNLKTRYYTIEQLGGSILAELEKTEQEVTQAWGRYLPKAEFTRGSPPGVQRVGTPQESAPTGSDPDAWIVEMQYRVAVAYQNAAWEKGGVELTNLFEQVKQEEVIRRMNLREFLVAFVQRQQRLFLSLPGTYNSVLETLVGKEVTRTELEEMVQSIIQARAEKYKKVSETMPGSNADGIQDEENDIHLKSPLTSDLFSKAKVVERKGSSVIAEWKTSLAIMTADGYLHFFDLDPGRAKPGIDPESAFRALMPNVVVPTSENMLLGKSNFSKGWSDTLNPSESVILGNCTIQFIDDKSFELMEKVTTLAASKMFGKLGSRTIQLRTGSKNETDDWIAVLTA